MVCVACCRMVLVFAIMHLYIFLLLLLFLFIPFSSFFVESGIDQLDGMNLKRNEAQSIRAVNTVN